MISHEKELNTPHDDEINRKFKAQADENFVLNGSIHEFNNKIVRLSVLNKLPEKFTSI